MQKTKLDCKEKWWDLGQHEYKEFASAKHKHLQMRDAGHKTRVVVRRRMNVKWYVVQIFCI